MQKPKKTTDKDVMNQAKKVANELADLGYALEMLEEDKTEIEAIVNHFTEGLEEMETIFRSIASAIARRNKNGRTICKRNNLSRLWTHWRTRDNREL
jgi:hypothetical protein